MIKDLMFCYRLKKAPPEHQMAMTTKVVMLTQVPLGACLQQLPKKKTMTPVTMQAMRAKALVRGKYTFLVLVPVNIPPPDSHLAI